MVNPDRIQIEYRQNIDTEYRVLYLRISYVIIMMWDCAGSWHQGQKIAYILKFDNPDVGQVSKLKRFKMAEGNHDEALTSKALSTSQSVFTFQSGIFSSFASLCYDRRSAGGKNINKASEKRKEFLFFGCPLLLT